MYNSDTVYSTATFRPVSPAPPAPPPPAPPLPAHPSPVRTRKLETPLHLDGGLFSDIRSSDGTKLLSKVTVDRQHSSMRRDVTDAPSAYESRGPHGNKDFVDDIIQMETITNEDVIKVKFTPIPLEVDAPRLLTPSQFVHKQTSAVKTPVEFIKDTYEDLQSYKIVNSVCKEKLLESDHVSFKEHFDTLSVSEPVKRAPSPLTNSLVSEQLSKIDHYLQESLDACSGSERGGSTPLSMRTTKMEERMRSTPISMFTMTLEEQISEIKDSQKQVFEEKSFQCATSTYNACSRRHEEKFKQPEDPKEHLAVSGTKDDRRIKSKSSSVKAQQPGVLCAIYNMPIHYHAMIICFLLIVYNLVYQYIKQNCLGNKK